MSISSADFSGRGRSPRRRLNSPASAPHVAGRAGTTGQQRASVSPARGRPSSAAPSGLQGGPGATSVPPLRLPVEPRQRQQVPGNDPGNPVPQPQQATQVVVEPSVAFQVVQQQSKQIADLVELVKAMSQLQAANLANSGGAAPASSSNETQPMEVDKDTGGVRHWKAESYIPKIPMLEHQKMTTRVNEISYWSQFVESLSSWLALLDDFYPQELFRAIITTNEIEQNSLEKGPAARSARFLNLLKQSLGDFQRALDLVRQCEQRQYGAACGYEAFRKLNQEFGVQSRMEATSLRESVLQYRPGKGLVRPLDVFRAVEAELLKTDRNLATFAELKLTEPEKVMLHLKCMPETCKHYVLLHGKSDTLGDILESFKFYDSHIRLIEYDKESRVNAKAFWNEETIAAFNKGKGKKGKGKGKKGGKASEGGQEKGGKDKGKGGAKTRASSEPAKPKGKCFFCHKPGHFAKDCPDKKKNGGDGKGSGQPAAKAKAGAQPGVTMMLANLPDFIGMSFVCDLENLELSSSELGRAVFREQEVLQHEREVFRHGQAVLPRGGEVFRREHAVLLGQEVFHGREHDSAHELEHDLLLPWHGLELGEPHTAALHEQHVVEEMSVSNLMFGRLGSSMDESLWDHLWLGDSGASIHLLSQSLIDSGHVVVVNEDFHEVRCSLASGEVLNLSRRVTVRAQFLTCDGSLVCAQLQALVTDCVRSLLSLGSLAAKGWSIGIESSGLRVSCLHGSYPRRRIRLYTYWYRNCGWLVSRSWRVTLVDGQPQLVGSLSTSLSSGSRQDGRISTGSAAHPEQRGGDSGGDNRSECGTRSSRGDTSSEFGARTRRGGSGSGPEHSRGGADGPAGSGRSCGKSGEAGGSDRLDTREGEASRAPIRAVRFSGPGDCRAEARGVRAEGDRAEVRGGGDRRDHRDGARFGEGAEGGAKEGNAKAKGE